MSSGAYQSHFLLCCPVRVPQMTGGLAAFAVVEIGDVAVTVSVSHLPMVFVVVLGPDETKLSKSNLIWQMSKKKQVSVKSLYA